MGYDGSLKFDTEIDESGFNKGLGKITKGMSAAAAGTGAAIGAAAVAAVKDANEMQQALNKLAAETGAGKAEMSAYEDVMQSIRSNNYGESFEDIGNAMATVRKQLGEMDPSKLQELTESAIAIRDTFDYDVNETVRASKAMMDQFGISGEEAMNLIVNGAQNGLDYSGELLDSISEYSVQFAKVGLSADDMFRIFESGVENGAWNLDKIGDAVKEFSIRAIDGSDTTIEGFQAIGMNADEMAQKFAAGGEEARTAFQQVISGLANMEDPVEQSIAGVNLFGTMWEDLGPEVIEQLAEIEDGAYGSKDALEDMKEVRYDDVMSSLSTLGKTVMAKVVDPIADKALPIIKDAIDGITESFDRPKSMLEEFTDEVIASSEAVKASVKNAQGIMDDAASEAAKMEEYKNILLDLNDVTAKTEFQKYQLKTIVSELSESIPQLAAAFDEEASSLNLTNEELVELFDNTENMLMYEAALEAQEETYKALFDAKMAQAKADSALETAQANYNDALKRNQLTHEEVVAGAGDYIEEINDTEYELRKAEAAQKSANDAAKEAQKEYDIEAEAIKGATEALGGQKAAADAVAEANQQSAKSGEGVAQSAEEQQAAIEALNQKYEEFRSQLEADIQNKISLFDSFDGGEDVTVEQMLANLESQRQGLEAWKQNMATLANEVGTTITPEFYNAILEMGPQAANAVQHMVDTLEQGNGRELLAQLASEWGGAMDFSSAAATGLSNTGKAVETGLLGMLSTVQGAGIEVPKKLANGIVNGKINVDSATEQLGAIVQQNMDLIKQMAANAGIQISPEIAAGLEQGGQAALTALQSLVDQMAGKSDEMGQAGGESGEAFSSEATSAIEEGKGDAANAATEVGKTVSEGAAGGIEQGSAQIQSAVGSSMQAGANAGNEYRDAYYQVGANMMSGLVAGMATNSGAVEQAARSAVSKAVSGAKNEAGIHSPSKVFRDQVGAHIAEGMAAGIDEGAGMVEYSARGMADASLQAAKDELEIHSPSGVFKREVGSQIVAGIRQGICEEQRKLRATMEDLSKSAAKTAKQAAEDGDYSGVGASIIDGITEGMQENEDHLQKKADAIISKYIEKASNGKRMKALEKAAEDNEEKAAQAEKKADEYKKDKKPKKEKEQREAAKSYRKASAQAAKEAERLRKAFSDAGEQLSAAMSEGISKEYERILEQTNEALSEISNRYQKLFDDIDSKRKGMFKKMSSASNMYDLDAQLEQIGRYQRGLDSIKNRIPDTLMDVILEMDVAEAANFTEYLNGLTEAQLSAYVSKWESIQGQAKNYSERFFKDELASLQNDFEKDINQAMADAEKNMKNAGKNIMRGLIQGLKSEKDLMSKEVKKIANYLIKSFRKAFAIRSPSRAMANEVGKYLPPGITKGFQDALPRAERQITAGVEEAIRSLQARIEAMQSAPVAFSGSYMQQPVISVTDSRPVQVNAQIHTQVDLDGNMVGRSVTPYVNQYLGDQMRREERGG